MFLEMEALRARASQLEEENEDQESALDEAARRISMLNDELEVKTKELE